MIHATHRLNLRVVRHRPDGSEIIPFPWRRAAWVALMVFDTVAAILFFATIK